MQESRNRRLSPAQAEALLRRAAEIHAAEPRGGRYRDISPEALIEAAGRAGIPEEQSRRALSEIEGGQTVEPRTLPRRLYGYSRVRITRRLGTSGWLTRERLEHLLRAEHGLKLRSSTEAGSLWDPGDALGLVRRSLDFSGERPLLKARGVELLVSERPGGCEVELIADLFEQRGEYLSLAGVLAATLSLPAAIAGVYEPLYLLSLPAAIAAPGLGFRLAYSSVREETRAVLESLVELAEEPGPEGYGGRERHRGGTQERRRSSLLSARRNAVRRGGEGRG